MTKYRIMRICGIILTSISGLFLLVFISSLAVVTVFSLGLSFPLTTLSASSTFTSIILFLAFGIILIVYSTKKINDIKHDDFVAFLHEEFSMKNENFHVEAFENGSYTPYTPSTLTGTVSASFNLINTTKIINSYESRQNNLKFASVGDSLTIYRDNTSRTYIISLAESGLQIGDLPPNGASFINTYRNARAAFEIESFLQDQIGNITPVVRITLTPDDQQAC